MTNLQERAATDHGQLGNGAPGFDPSGAPVNSDAKAAGVHAIPDAMIAMPRKATRRPADQTTALEDATAPATEPTPIGGLTTALVMAGLLGAVVLAFFLTS